ncbi:MAG TPA: DEAD/DEAH box helicase family protein [Armatimonadota bacterium]|nr:DEAD/DEAH box helicase family protein [Armatimonadota bacterium]
MRVLKIKASNMHDALTEAKRRLGEDAAVLHTKQIEEPVWLGLHKRKTVEILAAVDTSPVQVAVSRREPQRDDQLIRELAELRRVVANIGVEKELSPAAERLIRNGVSEQLAATITGSESDPIPSITARIRCAGEIRLGKRQTRVAIVGPTGVGKTTTVAKLAAHYALAEKKSVALLTLDNYRIGAVEQLATYGRILGIPIEVALSVEDVEGLVALHQDKDLILIDTVGRSQRNREQLYELSKLLKAANPTEVHLAVSASSSPTVQKEAVDSFGLLKADRLILTKLDECPQPGCILELAAQTLLPYSYVTNGQGVPDDISVADSKALAEIVWGGAA